jgi:hypothetical protein
MSKPKRRPINSTVKALLDAGLGIARGEHRSDGSVVVFAGKPGAAVTAFDVNPWGEALDHAQDQKRAS